MMVGCGNKGGNFNINFVKRLNFIYIYIFIKGLFFPANSESRDPNKIIC